MMEILPQEVLRIILSNPSLNLEDVVNFSSTCSYFRNLIMSDSIVWKNKFFSRWGNSEFTFPPDYDYFGEIQYAVAIRKRTLEALETIAPLCYKQSLLSYDFRPWMKLLSEKQETYYYICHPLYEIISNSSTNKPIKSIMVVPLNTPGNRTLRYCACTMLRYIKHIYVMQQWNVYKELPAVERSLEKSATFLAIWGQGNLHLTHRMVAKQLDCLADVVKEQLREKRPAHPVFATSDAELEQWRIEKSPMSKWDKENCHVLLETLRFSIDDKLGFHIADSFKSEIVFINKVLENRNGAKLLLAIIYESVARRLGLYLQMFRSGGGYQIKYQANGCEAVDPSGVVNSLKLIQELSPQLMVLQEGDCNLLRFLVELPYRGVDPSQWGVSQTPVIDFVRRIPRRRTPEIKYAVGMVMKLLPHNRSCVIITWNINLLGSPRIIYDVIIEDGAVRPGVPQEQLAPGAEVGNLLTVDQLGQHFSHFFENHFVPNAPKEAEYPDDAEVRHRYYHVTELAKYKF